MIVRELLSRLGMDVDKSGFANATTALARLHLALGGIRDIARTVKGALDKVLGDTAQAALDAENAARITGLTTQQIQQLGYAASTTGVSAEEMQMGLVHLARGAQEAALGTGNAAAAYQKLGIRASDVTGKLRPIGELLPEIASRFAGMPDGTQKAALAMEIFGRTGARLIPFLDKGPAGIAALSKEADRLGITMGTKSLQGALRYREGLAQLKGAFEGVRNAIADKLFPAVTASTARFREMLVVHRQWIALRVKEAFEVIARVLESLMRVGKGVVDLFERIWKSGGAGKAALIAFGAVITAMVAPLATFAGLLALVAEDIELYVSKGDKAKTVTGLIVGLWQKIKRDGIGNIFDELLVKAKPKIDELQQYMIDKFGDVPRQLLNRFFGAPPAAAAGAGSVGTQIPSPSVGMWNLLHHLFGDDYEGNHPQMLSPAIASSMPLPWEPGGDTYVFHVTQGSGEDGEDFARRVATIVQQERGKEYRAAADHLSKNRSR